MATDAIRMQDLLDIPDPHVPVGLCLDTSGSMNSCEGGVDTGRTTVIDGKTYRVVTGGGPTRLDTLQKGLGLFYDAVYNDENARYAAEISIVTFDDSARVMTDFSRVEYNDVRENPPVLKASGRTSLGEGLNLTLDLLDKRKKEYKERGVDYYQPWLVIMTDGENNGSEASLARARQRIHELVNASKLCVFPFLIGKDEGLETLASLSPAQEPMRISVTQMKGMFKWLGKSIAEVSNQCIGTDHRISLNIETVTSWDEPLL